MNLLSEIKKSRIVAILRGYDLDETLHIAEALQEAGLFFIEVAFHPDFTDMSVASVIHTLCGHFPKLHIGAGTVLTVTQAQAACQAGAEYIISPNVNLSVIEETKRLGMISIPGALSPSETVSAFQAGADIIKIFPSSTLGPGYISALRSPLPHIPLAAVGGIDLDNICDFLKTGIYFAGIGGNIVPADAVHSHQYDKIKDLAQLYVHKAATVTTDSSLRIGKDFHEQHLL